MSGIDLVQKKVYIFDMDGTLYSQQKMRSLMAKKLLVKSLFKPATICDIIVILKFRRLREKEEYKDVTIDELYRLVGDNVGKKQEFVKQIIERWMFRIPLECIQTCKYESVIDYILTVQEDNKKVILYSDYPVEDKAKALGITCDKMYSAGQGIPDELKPSKKIMDIIISDLVGRGYERKDILYVGDRDEKDGISAKLGGIDYIDISLFKKMVI